MFSTGYYAFYADITPASIDKAQRIVLCSLQKEKSVILHLHGIKGAIGSHAFRAAVNKEVYCMTGKQKESARKQIVSKSNDLIQNVRFDLSAQEQKIIAYMVSKIKPTDTALNYIPFRLSNFLELGGSTEKTLAGGSAKDYLKTTLKSLRDKSFYITREDGKEVLCAWLHKVMLDYDGNMVMLKLDEDLMPYLVGLSGRFTHYEVFYILQMTSGYSIRLYELLKSEEWLNKPVLYMTDELKRLFGVENVKTYKNTGDFCIKILDRAAKEINELTDLKVRYKKITKGRKITHLQFFIKGKQGAELDKARQANEDRRGGQVHMETPQTSAEAFPIAELAENIEELNADFEIPKDYKDCKTYAELQAYRAKYAPHYHIGWIENQANDNRKAGVFEE